MAVIAIAERGGDSAGGVPQIVGLAFEPGSDSSSRADNLEAVRISFTLTESAEVTLEFRDEKAPDWQPIEDIPELNPRQRSRTSMSAGLHTLTWNAAGSGLNGFHEVLLRANARNGDGKDSKVLEGRIGNTPPLVTDIVVPAETSGNVVVGFQLADAEGDLSTIELLVLTDGGELVIPSVHLVGGTRNLEPGQRHELTWKSAETLRGRNLDPVALAIQPRDGLWNGTGAMARSDPFAVLNNSAPEVEIFDIASSLDRSFEIPIRFRVSDGEGDPVSVIFQWAPAGGAFPPLEDLPLEDPDFLDSLLADRDPDSEAARLRRERRILTEAPVVVRGNLESLKGLSPGQIRVSGLVRESVVHPVTLPGREAPSFLLGQEIRFPGAADESETWYTITGFDPRTSVATLSEPIDPPTGSRYELRRNRGVLRLESSPTGIFHTFVWDSRRDVGEAGTGLDSVIQIQALGIDTRGERFSANRVFRLESSSLAEFPALATRFKGSRAVAIGDLNGDGKADIALINSITRELAIYYRLESGDFPFNGSVTLSTIGEPNAVAIADLNGDGRNDIVIAAKPDRLRIFLQQDANDLLRFSSPPVDLAVGQNPESIAIDDLDRDGRNDIAVANFASNSVNVYLQSSPLVFQLWKLHPFRGPRAVAIGDVNGDGEKDVVVAGWNFDNRGAAAILLQRVDGGARTLEPIEPLPVDRPSAAALGDLNADGRADLLIVGEDSGTASVFLQDQTGGLPRAPSLLLRTGVKAVSAAIGDLDSDDLDDAVIAGERSGTVAVYLQGPGGVIGQRRTGDVLFSPSRILDAGNDPVSVAIGDIDEDGRGDLLVANKSSEFISVYHQTFPGDIPAISSQLVRMERPPPGVLPVPVAIGDVDGDGRPDIVAGESARDAVPVYLQGVSGNFPEDPSSELATDPIPVDAAIGDLDGDGRNDLVVACESGTATVFFLGPGGSLEGSIRLQSGSSPSAVAIGDLDGDGRNDVAVANRLPGQDLRFTVSLFTRIAAARAAMGPVDPEMRLVTGRARTGTARGPSAMAAGDMDGDGLCDLVVANESLGLLDIFLQHGSGILVPRIQISTGGAPRAVALGDLDRDGRSDIVSSFELTNLVVLFFQGDDGTFSSSRVSQLKMAANPFQNIVGDVDADGLNDVLGISNSLFLEFHLQNSGVPGRMGRCSSEEDSTCISSKNFKLPVGPSRIASGDINLDGRTDLVISFTNATIGIYLAR